VFVYKVGMLCYFPLIRLNRVTLLLGDSVGGMRFYKNGLSHLLLVWCSSIKWDNSIISPSFVLIGSLYSFPFFRFHFIILYYCFKVSFFFCLFSYYWQPWLSSFHFFLTLGSFIWLPLAALPFDSFLLFPLSRFLYAVYFVLLFTFSLFTFKNHLRK